MPVRPRSYYFTILLFYYFTILLFYYFTILLFYYFTILLFYYFTILIFYYFTILLFYYFTILLFYYFTILLMLREIGSLHLENPTLHVGPGFHYPEKIPPCLFTFNRISSTGSAVCISKTHLCRSDPDFTISLYYYFTILLFYYFTILLFYYFTILLFYYFTILLFYYFTILLILRKSGVCISKTQPCMSDQDSIIQRKFLPVSLLLIGFPPRAQQFASRKPTCAGPTQILLFYYFTNFTGNREFASRKPNLACRTRILLSRKHSSLSLYF